MSTPHLRLFSCTFLPMPTINCPLLLKSGGRNICDNSLGTRLEYPVSNLQISFGYFWEITVLEIINPEHLPHPSMPFKVHMQKNDWEGVWGGRDPCILPTLSFPMLGKKSSLSSWLMIKKIP